MKSWIVALLVLSGSIILYWLNAFQMQQSGERDIVSDVTPSSLLVIPGSGQGYFYRPNYQFNGRVSVAIQLLNKHPELKVLLSGYHDGKLYHETTDMAQELVKSGITADRILYDSASYDSFQTIINLRKRHLPQTIIFASQKEHLERMLWISGQLELKAHGIIAPGYPNGTPSWIKARERMACVKARLEAYYYRLTQKRLWSA